MAELFTAVKSNDVDTVRLLLQQGKYHVDCRDELGQTPLHNACENGYVDMVRVLMSEFNADPSIHSDFKLPCSKDNDIVLDLEAARSGTPLHYACEKGHLDVVKELVSEFKADVSVRDQTKCTPLHYASKEGHVNVVRALASEFKSDVSVTDEWGWTPLHHACENGYLDVVRTLVSEFKADVSVTDEWGSTPLHCTCENGHLDVVRALVSEFKADVSVREENKCTPLHYACKEGHLNLVKALVSEFKADVSVRDENKCTPLHYACKEGHLDVARALVSEFMADVSVTDEWGSTPLHSACENGYLDVVRALVSEFKADVNARDEKDENQRTPLHYACEEGYLDVVKALVSEFKANVNVRDQYECTPLHYACVNGYSDIVRALVSDFKAEVYVQDKYKSTPLHYACKEGHMDVVRALVSEFKADVSARDENKCTPLHSACEKGQLDVAKALVSEFKADVCVRDENKCNPLHYACKEGHVNVVRALVSEFKADVSVRDENECTPLHYACKKGHLDVARALVSEFKADISVRDHNECTPLVYACANGHLDVARALVSEFKADVSVRDHNECTPLLYACANGHLNVVRALVSEFKADASVRGQCTPLHYACVNGHLNVVRALVSEFKANVSIRDETQCTPLHYACQKGDLDVVRALVSEFKADVCVRDQNECTPLHYGCKKGHLDVVRALVSEFKADVSVRDQNECTPLLYACANGHLDVVRALVSEFKADVSVREQNECTPLHYACVEGHLDVVRALVSEFKADVSVRDETQCTPLHYACQEGRLDVVRALVSEFDAEVNRDNLIHTWHFVFMICDHYREGNFDKVNELVLEHNSKKHLWNVTPLHFACGNGHLNVVRALVSEFRANVSATDQSNKTPLHYACRQGHLDVVRALVSKFNAYVSVRDYSKLTPLHYACEKGHLDVVRALVSEFKADISVTDQRNNTPLHHACENGHLDVVRALVSEFKADTSVTNEWNRTPLHLACEKGHLDVVRALVLEFKADVSVIDINKTLLHHACENRHFMVRALVLEFKAHVNVTDTLDMTPLHHACKKGYLDVVRTLVAECKADVSVRDYAKLTPLHYACEKGHLDVVRVLVSEFKVDVDSVGGWSNKTPLHNACEKGNLNVVKALVSELKADVNVRDESNMTPLHHACEKGHLDVIRALVSELKADVSVGGQLDEVTELVSKFKADLSIPDNHGRTALMLAAKAGHDGIVFALVHDYQCPRTDTDRYGWGVFHYACAGGSGNVLQNLILDNASTLSTDTGKYDAEKVYNLMLSLVNIYGYDPSAPGDYGRTLLHLASYDGHDIFVQALLKFTSPLVTNKRGDTPLHLAARQNQVNCVKSLLDANAPVLIRNSSGRTPLDVASGESKELLAEHIKVNRQQIQDDYDLMTRHAENRYSGSHYMTRIFILGNPGAGKSTFIESLKREGFFQSFSKVSESSVPPHTAGIIPSVHMSKKYGRVMFYDFAGDTEYYSSHAAIFESLASSRKGNNIFVIVADLRKDDASIKTTLHFWFSFIQYQNFSKASFIVLGSHLDQSTQSGDLEEFCIAMQHNVHNIKHFKLDCRDPRSNQIAQFKRLILTWVNESQKYELSSEARLLLGLLEKDFSAVTACPVQTLVSHIKDSGVWLPVAPKLLYPILLELHEVGVLLLLGDCTKDSDHVILNISKLTNEVHELLFTKSALSKIKKAAQPTQLNIGVLPEEILTELLPSYVTIECLVHLQYCQKISFEDIGVFSSFKMVDSTSQSFLFFPALCSAEKSQVSWDESSDNFSIGWLALCTDPHDYFPPRFLHVLLLRLVYGFTLTPAQHKTAHSSPEHSRRCTMWKKGVYWRMEEGVDCFVELVNGNKGVVVFSKSSSDEVEDCVKVFTKVVSCVMEAKAEFCHSTKPEFFLLDSIAEADYLNEDHQFALSDVERTLENLEGKCVISVSGNGKMELSKLQCMRKLTHWDSLFPIDFNTVIDVLKDIVKSLYDLGQNLGASRGTLERIEVDFPHDVNQRKRELVRWWMSSSNPPCWWHLVQALRKIHENVLADKIRKEYDLHIKLQEKMLGEENQALKPDEEFLHSLSSVVGSRWPSLALPLMLNEEEIDGLKRKVGHSHQELAFQMLKIWASREDATYGQLCCKLKTISLFQ